MKNYKDLYKLIESLKNKINKLDKKQYNTNINSYRIINPNQKNLEKKYTALLFDKDFKDLEENYSNENFNSFIKLSNNNLVINYTISFNIIKVSNKSNICSISLGIKDKLTSKIKIIKGSTLYFDVSNKSIIVDNKIYLTNTIIYNASKDEELCIIAELNDVCNINNKKSIIKILSI